jgi:hypothetical protein
MNPTAIAIDEHNKIYVADTLGKRVSMYQLVNTSAGDSAGRDTRGGAEKGG